MWTARSDSRVFLPVVALLVLGAWVSLAAWGVSPAGYLLHHDTLGNTRVALDLSFLATMGAFVLGWNLMIVAMMLPSIIPLLTILERTVGAARARTAVAAAIGGYIAVWSAFGTLAHAFDYLIHVGIDSHAWMHENAWLLGVAPLVVAGTYQFTPLKHLCLDKCRSPFSFVAARWRGDGHVMSALRIGVDHGIFCLGCCWALMLLMFAVSAGNLAWMLLLAAVMGIEKNLPWGRRLSTPVGVVLISGGITLAILNL